MKQSFSMRQNPFMSKAPIVGMGLLILCSIMGVSLLLHAMNHPSTARNCTSSSVQLSDEYTPPNCTQKPSHHATQVKDQTVLNGDVLGSEILIVPRQVASTPPLAPQPVKNSPTQVPPTAIPYPNSPGQAGVIAMIKQVFGPYADGALNVARCESGFNPLAFNPVSNGGNHAEGVFQILYPSTWNGTSEAASSPYNAMANILAAHQIFVRDGYSWREWSCAA